MAFRLEMNENNVPFIQVGNHQLRLELEELEEPAENETFDVVEQALEHFKTLILEEPNLHLPLDDTNFLIKFLRPFKFDPDKAFKMLKQFYKFKFKYPKYATNVTPTCVKHVYDSEVLVFFPTRSKGSRLMMCNVGKWDPKAVSLKEILKGVMLAMEIAMVEPKTQIGGVHVILNMDGLSLKHVYQLSPKIAKLITEWVQECAPVRLRGIHVINQSLLFDMAFAIFKPFIDDKIKQKLHFHGQNRASLCDQISAEALPQSLGGVDALDFPGTLLSEILSYYEDIFKKADSFGYTKEKT